MSISSAIAPDLDAVCRALVGRGIRSAERIGAGRNSRVFRADLAPAGEDDAGAVVIKFYRRDPGDPRDRLAVEFGALQFLWQNDVRVVPRPIAADPDRYCAVYEYIAGEAPDLHDVSIGDVDQSVRFLAQLKALRGVPGSAAVPLASEASFSLQALPAALADRLIRLRASPREVDGVPLGQWLDGTFEPLLREVLAWAAVAASRASLAFDAELAPAFRTLSPSDFGFHNAIRRPDGLLAFVDFEYFGWDDPAKTLVDFVLHPGMSLDGGRQQRFVDGFAAAFADVAGLADRARIVYPLYGLKWCLILLNDFLPERLAAAAAGRPGDREPEAARAIQMAKADRMAQAVRRNYQDNPLWAHT